MKRRILPAAILVVAAVAALLVGVIGSRFVLPVVVVEIGLGIVVGPEVLGFVEPDEFLDFFGGKVLGVPVLVIIFALVSLAGWILLNRTTFGRRTVAVGGNPEAARLCGIAVDRVRIASYVISSVLAGIAGLFLVGYVGSIDNWVGRGYELDSIVACVMGGVAITGGRGSIFGALAGALILIILFNLVLLLGFQVQWQYVLKGVIIIVAAAFYLNRSP